MTRKLALVFTILALLVSFSSAAAAQNALPGSPLYAVKTTLEKVTLMAQPSEYRRAEKHLELAQRRLKEAQALAARGQKDAIPALLQEFNQHVQAASQVAAQLSAQGNAGGVLLSRQVSNTVQNSTATLMTVASQAPQAVSAVMTAVATPAAMASQPAPMSTPAPTSATPMPTPTAMAASATPTAPLAGTEVTRRGVVESIAADQWMVDGTPFLIATDTQIESGIQVGDFVKVEAFVQADGSLVARQIERETPDMALTGTPMPQAEEVTQRGVVESMAADQWVVDGTTFLVTADTQIKGDIQVGDFVKVEAFVQADGSLVAHEIKKEASGAGMSGTPAASQTPAATPQSEDEHGKGHDHDDED